MRILFLTENFPPETNAAATRVFERACYWQQWGHSVTIVTCAPNFPYGRVFDGWRNTCYQVDEMEGLKVVRVKTYIAANEGVFRRTFDFLSFMVTGSLAALVQRKPDVIVATSPQFFVAVAGWAVGVMRRTPFVFELGDLWPASIAAVGAMRASPVLRLLERLELFLYRRSAAVVALTERFKDNLISRGIPGGKVVVVRNGVDLPRYSPRPRDETLAREFRIMRRLVVGYVGTIGMAHGLINILDAAERLTKRQDIQLLLVGSGAERETIIQQVKRRHLSNVVVAPPQPKERMPAVWSLCDIALVHLKDSPVFAEVIPSKMFEAMAMGLPLILALPEGEATAILTADSAGIAVAPGNPDALAEVICRLADDPALRARLAAAALQSAPLHSRETQARSMISALERVVAGHGHSVGLS